MPASIGAKPVSWENVEACGWQKKKVIVDRLLVKVWLLPGKKGNR